MRKQFSYLEKQNAIAANNVRHTRIDDLLNSENSLMVGLGQIKPWPLEAVPPAVDLKRLWLFKSYIYVPLSKKSAFPEVISSAGGVIIDGIEYATENLSDEERRDQNCLALYLQAEFNHNDLPFSSFRSLVVYESVEIATDIDSDLPFYFDEQLISKNPIYTENFKPIFIQRGVKQVLGILLNYG